MYNEVKNKKFYINETIKTKIKNESFYYEFINWKYRKATSNIFI